MNHRVMVLALCVYIYHARAFYFKSAATTSHPCFCCPLRTDIFILWQSEGAFSSQLSSLKVMGPEDGELD